MALASCTLKLATCSPILLPLPGHVKTFFLAFFGIMLGLCDSVLGKEMYIEFICM